MLGLRFCVRAFSSCGKWGPLFIAMHGPLTIAASLAAEHRLQTRRLSNCGSRAQPLRGMWDLPRPGHEPVSPALADRLSTTAPPGKPLQWNIFSAGPVTTTEAFTLSWKLNLIHGIGWSIIPVCPGLSWFYHWKSHIPRNPSVLDKPKQWVTLFELWVFDRIFIEVNF